MAPGCKEPAGISYLEGFGWCRLGRGAEEEERSVDEGGKVIEVGGLAGGVAAITVSVGGAGVSAISASLSSLVGASRVKGLKFGFDGTELGGGMGAREATVTQED